MADKKIVDDCYSNIASSSTSDKKDDISSRKKIKIKTGKLLLFQLFKLVFDFIKKS